MSDNNSSPIILKYNDNSIIYDEISKHQDDNTIKAIPNSVPLKYFYSKTLRGNYDSSGTGLAVNGGGTIDITNYPPGSTVEAAFLFWSMFRAANAPIIPTGKLNSTTITGDLIGSAGFIGYSHTDAFVSDVTKIAQFGTNTLSDFPHIYGDYQTNGASLVVIYSNPNLSPKTVVIYDGIVEFYRENITTTIENFTAGPSSIQAKTTYIAGQGFPPNAAYFNGEKILDNPFFSPSSAPSTWFWNNVTLPVSTLVKAGDTSATATIQNESRFIIDWVAQVFCVNAASPSRGIALEDLL